MCDPVLIVTILEEMGYFDQKKEVNKEEVPDEEPMKDNSKNKGEEQK